MKFTYYNLLDILFVLFIFSTVAMSNSIIGKAIQLIFVISSLIFSFSKVKKFSMYNFLEIIFVLYILIQIIFDIAVIKTGTSQMMITMFYCALYSLGLYNYICYRKDMNHIITLYTKATLFALFLIMILYFKSLLMFRLDASTNISAFGLVLFGGASSTALSLMAVIPAFFIVLYPPKKNIKKAIPYVLVLSVISFLTGTRKTLLLVAFIIFVYSSLKSKNKSFISMKNVIVVLLSATTLYFLIMNVPVLYNIIGSRLERSITYFNTTETFDSSIIVRNRMIDKAIDLFNERPIFGWGLDYFRVSYQNDLGYYTHNNFLELLSGAGIIGFILYYLKYVYLLKKMIQSYFLQKENRKRWLSCLGFFIIMVILEYWQVTYFYRYIIIYQVLLLAMLKLTSEERKIKKGND